MARMEQELAAAKAQMAAAAETPEQKMARLEQELAAARGQQPVAPPPANVAAAATSGPSPADILASLDAEGGGVAI